MAKIYGLFGSMTGKLADTVMAVRNGEQIARKYQPVVLNPNTPGQIAVRARMKLMSQLSAEMASVIAFRRQGPISSRNFFTKKNFKKTSFVNNEAKIQLESIDLTGGVTVLPGILLTGPSGTPLSIQLERDASDINRIVYLLFEASEEGIRFIDSNVATVDADHPRPGYTSELNAGAGRTYLALAYGVRDNTEAARVLFGDITVPDAEDIAKVITSRSLTESDITLTETKGAVLVVPQS